MKQIVVSDDIMEKVINREEDAARLNRCLAAKICPECGEDIDRETLNDGGRVYNCIECGFNLTKPLY